MVKVVLMLCTGGLSSQLFLKSVMRAAEDNGYKVAIDFGSVLYNREMSAQYSGLDYLFLYAPATEITKDALETAYLTIDTVMISPQVRYMSNSIKTIAQEYTIKCLLLEPETFAELAGKECFEIIK